jgi:hypothetical protein
MASAPTMPGRTPSRPDEFRPLITGIVTLALLVLSSYLVLIDKINADTWFQAWLQIVVMLLGFFFATRSEQKRKEDAK